MKKILLMTLACLLFVCSASANSWGLRGGIINIVENSDRYEEYTATADSGNKIVMDRHVNQAIMESRYHAQLIAAWRNGCHLHHRRVPAGRCAGRIPQQS